MESDNASALIGGDEPPAFATVSSGRARRPIVVVCDHASNRVPAALAGLGLDERHLLDHIAWDIGAGAVALELTERLGAKAVLGGYSRLVVDLNRSLTDASAFAAISDGVLVPGNLGLDAAAREARAQALYWPYHDAVRRMLDEATSADERPVMLAVHSFTPRQHGIERPWHVGVLWDKDPRLPLKLMQRMRGEGDVVVGDNEPYSGRHPADFTIDHHAEPRGIAHASIEIRQDLIRDDAGRERWAARLGELLDDVLGDPALYRPLGRHGDGRVGAARHAGRAGGTATANVAEAAGGSSSGGRA